jgi:CHAT domain-containing protein
MGAAQASSWGRTLLVAPQVDTTDALEHIDLEVAAVAAALPGATQMRSAVTKAAVLRAMRQADVVHFACHGRADPLEPLDTYLMLDGDDRLRVADLLDEPYRTRRLAVLSACETGIAGVNASTEVVGFPTLFLRLGFAGVVGSLWPVRDDATALLVTRFYQELNNRPPAQALATAQRWLRSISGKEASELLGNPVVGDKPFAHVEFWAGFTFMGA